MTVGSSVQAMQGSKIAQWARTVKACQRMTNSRMMNDHKALSSFQCHEADTEGPPANSLFPVRRNQIRKSLAVAVCSYPRELQQKQFPSLIMVVLLQRDAYQGIEFSGIDVPPTASMIEPPVTTSAERSSSRGCNAAPSPSRSSDLGNHVSTIAIFPPLSQLTLPAQPGPNFTEEDGYVCEAEWKRGIYVPRIPDR
jgi:hypothetical protein